MTNWDNIVFDKQLVQAAKIRKPLFVEKKDWTVAAENNQSDGWTLVSQYKNPLYSKYTKPKSFDEQFEDAVWMMFKEMGFTHMNKDRNFKMSYDQKNLALTKQIDVFAVEEDNKDCCISVEAIRNAISKCHFLSQFDKNNALVMQGTFDYEDMNKTSQRLYELIAECIRYMMTSCSKEWEKGEQGLLANNRPVHGMIRVIDDLVLLLKQQNKIDPLNDTISKIVSEITFYLEALADYINQLDDVGAKDIRSTYGTNGDIKYYRYFEKPISDKNDDYNPEGLVEYFENQTKKYNAEARQYLIDIEDALRVKIREALQNKFGNTWEKQGVPKDLLGDLHQEAFKKNYEADDSSEIEDWDCSSMKDFARVALYGSNWSVTAART